ncbi:MAG: aspartate kinase [Fusobacterium sp.]|nr:aspartate kinase [Fusobacterium sp.]
MKNVKILKFGGSSVSNFEKIKAISDYLKSRVEKNEKLVVVVPAMGKTTDILLNQVKELTNNPNTREVDSLLAIGEQTSISFMAITLNDIGVKARSLNGIQAGIKTFGKHTKSKIAEINSEFLLEELKKFDVLVIAGFQGVNDKFEITTLGGGGSDTTAVALAATLNTSCEIYTDVSGVFGTDPRIYPNAKKLEQVSFEEMLELSALGAGVLETRCVEIAKNYDVPLYLAKTLSEEKGTWVMKHTDLLEKKVVTGAALDSDILHVTLTYESSSTVFVKDLFDNLDKYGVNIDMISQVVSNSTVNISFTCKNTDINFLNRAIESLTEISPSISTNINDECSKVSIVGSGMRDVSGVATRAFKVLGTNGIKFYQITTSEISISFAVDRSRGEEALRLLCEEFNI